MQYFSGTSFGAEFDDLAKNIHNYIVEQGISNYYYPEFQDTDFGSEIYQLHLRVFGNLRCAIVINDGQNWEREFSRLECKILAETAISVLVINVSQMNVGNQTAIEGLNIFCTHTHDHIKGMDKDLQKSLNNLMKHSM